MEKKQIHSEISIINLSKYTAPEIVESRNKEWIEYGKDNNYFDYLIKRYTGSTTNGAIINGIVKMIYGKGLEATDSNRKPDEFAQMISLFKKNDLKRFITDRKMLGMAAFQISYEKGKIKQVSHFPINTLRAEKKNKDGDIEAWYYHPKWIERKPSEAPLRINSFGFGNKKGNEMFILQPYVAGYDYYSPVDYVGALGYALLEEEITDYLINDTLNGFSGTKVINFNNGIPDPEKRNQIKRDVLNKVTGARGEKVIVAFNSNKESETTVVDLPLNDAPAHYQYLADECRNKLIVAHRVTSPMLIGVRETGGGLGNNADEIETASLLFLNNVIKGFQNEITEVIQEILSINLISLKVNFERIQPLDSGIAIKNKLTDAINSLSPLVANKVLGSMTENEIRELIGLLPKVGGDTINMATHENELIAKGENLSSEWILIDENEVDYENENDYDLEIQELNKTKLSVLQKLGITARPNAKSDDDENIEGVKFITRYKYSGDNIGERKFCRDMLSADKVYRKEDLEMQDSESVNRGHGHEGQPYNIFLYKGGVNCKHKFLRQTYINAKGSGIDVNSPNAKQISTNKAEGLGYRIRNPKEVAMIPFDMPRHGHHPDYGK